MSNYVDEDTDFSNVTIKNDYTCLVGGTWTAKLVNGKTVYVSADGTQSYDGPVNLIGANLIVANGADADNVVVVGSSTNATPTVTVQAGGTLSNSTIFTSSVTIAAQGDSSGNSYVSSSVSFSAGTSTTAPGGSSDNDYFYNIASTTSSSGTLDLSGPSSSDTSTSFQTSTGSGAISMSTGSTANNYVSIDSPHVISNGSASSTSVNLSLGNGAYFGNSSFATNQPVGQYVTNYGYTITNSNPVYSGVGTANAGNTTWTAKLVDGKTVYVNKAGYSYSGPLNLYGITSLTIENGAVVDGITVAGLNTAPTITIKSGGTLQNSFVADATIINSGTSQNNTYTSPDYIGMGGSVSSGDYMLETGPSSAHVSFSKDTTITQAMLSTAGTSSVTLVGTASFDSYMQNGSASGTFTFEASGASTINCFLAGSMIQTINGYVAIEDLQIGDQIITYNEGQETIKSVVWKGYNTVTVNPNLDKDQAGYPIRILKDAIADGVPYKDMLITPEHCLFFNNQFVPAYMLVNDHSIFYDTSITEYTYYHIETEEHSVINADGMLTESYLDTGNRHNYYQDHNVISIQNKHKAWSVDSAAPLVTKRDVVEVIFNKIKQRIQQIGLTYSPKTVSTTEDNDLYLLTDTGEVLYQTGESNERVVFKLPSDIKHVRIISGSGKPSDVIGPFVNDRRNLGVLVGNITLVDRNNTYEINQHLTSRNIQGWDAETPQLYRWTNGSAYLEIPSHNRDSVRMLVLHIVANGSYVTENTKEALVANM